MKTLNYAALTIGALCVALMTAQADEIALEAELAQEIEPDVVIAVPGDVDEAGGPAPNEPSNGKFVWAPGPPGGPGGGSGYARFTFPIKDAGTYLLFGHIVAWDGNSDSFWVTIWQDGNKNADDDPNPQVSKDQNYRWALNPKGNNWVWDRVNHWLDAGTFDREWELEEGLATITIWSRENASMLDALFLTDDANAATGRLPTDEERELQRNNFNLSVDPSGKLASAWATLKTR